MDMDLFELNTIPRRAGGTHRALVNDSGQSGALWRMGKLRGPNKLGNLVMPGLLGRATGWLLYVKTI